MEINDLLTTGNITTIVVWIVNLILPYVASYGIDRDVLTSVIFTIIWFGFTVYSSANPNTFDFLGNKVKEAQAELGDDELVLNDEYVESADDDESC